MKISLFTFALILNSASHAQSTESFIKIEQEEVSIEIETQPALQDEGTNEPTSTGSTKHNVNGKIIYIKQYELIRIEQTEN